jgi:hypothetical protein
MEAPAYSFGIVAQPADADAHANIRVQRCGLRAALQLLGEIRTALPSLGRIAAQTAEVMASGGSLPLG